MVHFCANPNCKTPFRYLHEGRLFHLKMETRPTANIVDALMRPAHPSHSVEHYWLCNNCCRRFKLVLREDLEPMVQLVPLETLETFVA
ncbi:MAG: hypothetical protein HYX26_01790 [Acidobacteriales bacterium]|nr:hypothetical protein [Terriglobales bacterium]